MKRVSSSMLSTTFLTPYEQLKPMARGSNFDTSSTNFSMGRPETRRPPIFDSVAEMMMGNSGAISRHSSAAISALRTSVTLSIRSMSAPSRLSASMSVRYDARSSSSVRSMASVMLRVEGPIEPAMNTSLPLFSRASRAARSAAATISAVEVSTPHDASIKGSAMKVFVVMMLAPALIDASYIATTRS